MMDLMSADFIRLLKSQIFKGVLIFCVESLIFEIIINFYNKELTTALLEGLLVTNYIVFGIIIAAFVGLYIGTEYSDRTIRNKIISGYSRTQIYISNLAVCLVAGFVILLLNAAVITITKFILLKLNAIEAVPAILAAKRLDGVLERQILGFYIIVVYTAFFLFITMMLSSKSAGTTVVMVLSVIILIFGNIIYNSVENLKNSSNQSNTTSSSSSIQTDADFYKQLLERNNDKNDVKKIKLYYFLYDYIPSSQSKRLTEYYVPDSAEKFVIYDLSTALIFSVLGIVLFNRKDLK